MNDIKQLLLDSNTECKKKKNRSGLFKNSFNKIRLQIIYI